MLQPPQRLIRRGPTQLQIHFPDHMYSLLFHLRGERLEYGRAVGRVRPAQRIALPLRMPLHAPDRERPVADALRRAVRRPLQHLSLIHI